MLVHVERLDCLEKLSLDGSLVSDSGLMHLEGLTRLRWLNLRDTKVGDAGVDHLRRLTELRRLNLRRTSVSDAGFSSPEGAGQPRGSRHRWDPGHQRRSARASEGVAEAECKSLSPRTPDFGPPPQSNENPLRRLRKLYRHPSRNQRPWPPPNLRVPGLAGLSVVIGPSDTGRPTSATSVAP